jgi:hypothetical protein
MGESWRYQSFVGYVEETHSVRSVDLQTIAQTYVPTSTINSSIVKYAE